MTFILFLWECAVCRATNPTMHNFYWMTRTPSPAKRMLSQIKIEPWLFK